MTNSASRSHQPGIGLFMTGAVVGAIVTLGLGTEEGRRLSEKLIAALKEISGSLTEEGEPGSVGHLPPPPVSESRI